jgi:PDZ domain
MRAQVLKFNGVAVHNVAHLAQMVSACQEEFGRFQLEWSKVPVLPTARLLPILALN